MEDNIIDAISTNKIKGAVCQFSYKGYLISLSQVFKGSSVGVFKDDFEEVGFSSVESAIDFINKRSIQSKK
jgi:hypothetical protein